MYFLIEARKFQSAEDFELYSKIKEDILQINKKINERVNPSIAQLGNNIEAGLKIDGMTQKRLLISAINTLNKGISAEATVELNALLASSKEFNRRIKEAGTDKGTLTQIIQEIEGLHSESKQTIGSYREQLNVRTVDGKQRMGG